VAVSRANGVGSKLAARIVTELKDKASGIELGPQARVGGAFRGEGKGRDDGEDRRVSDAVSGLVNLGYGRTEAYGAVIEALREIGDDARVEALIRRGLARLGAAA
jgi:Holliday junction DNA helicase RuvA